MKGCVYFLIAFFSVQFAFANISDTTATTFEIHLKRRSDQPLGFNTCNIDRMKIYDVVLKKLSAKINLLNIYSVHDPKVVMKFEEYVTSRASSKGYLSLVEQRMLEQHHFNYFIKIHGYLDIDSPLNQFQKATFTLRVYIFDSTGNLISKSRSRSVHRDAAILGSETVPGEEDYAVNEDEFFRMVTSAASSIEITL